MEENLTNSQGMNSRIHSIEVFPTACTELDFLRPSVESMFDVIDSFVDQECRAGRIWLPYWSNERAMLSQFIGGVWRSNPSNYAVEEYSCKKGEGDKKYQGRRDAWFRAAGQACFVEAKLAAR